MEIDTAAGSEERTEPRPGARSCTTCSKAKAKCVRRPDQQICERCARLKKDCYMKDPVPRRRKQLKATRAAQLEQLETKIEHLVNALSSQRGAQAEYGSQLTPGQPTPPISQSDPGTSKSAHILQGLCVSLPEEEGSPCSDTSGNSSCDPRVTALANKVADYEMLGVTMSEADILLDRYKRLMAPGLPFVVFPAEMTAQQMFNEKPLLLHSIVMVTYFHDFPRQQEMAKHLMRDISERILINSEKNVGILQALLVFVAWYHPHVFTSQHLTNLLHLAIAMTIDLSIDRIPTVCGSEFKSAPPKAPKGTSVAPNTLDEHRVLAGTYYLTSMLASSFKRVDALTSTKFLDNCLNILEETKEYPSDATLVQMCRIQRTVEEITAVDCPTAPIQMYLKAFTADLEKTKARDQTKGENLFLRMQYLTAETFIWELAVSDLQDNKPPLHLHLENVYRCLDVVKSFLDLYFSIPVYMYLTLPFAIFSQFGHCFILMTKVASLEVEGWDPKCLDGLLDFGKTIDEIVSRYDAARKITPDGLACNNPSFDKWSQRMRWVKSAYESKFQPEAAKMNEKKGQETQVPPPELYDPGVMPPIAQQQPTPPDDMLSSYFFNYMDENFWQGLSGDMDLGWNDMAMN